MSDFLVLSGSIPRGMNVECYKDLINKLQRHCKVVVDAEGELLRLSMDSAPYMIKPNIYELESICGKKLQSEYEVIIICKNIITCKNIRYIIVTLGEKGCLLIGKEIVLKAKAIPTNVQSTVGAGDSLLAGFIFGLIETRGSREVDALISSLKYGVASSSIGISNKIKTKIKYSELTYYSQKVVVENITESYIGGEIQ